MTALAGLAFLIQLERTLSETFMSVMRLHTVTHCMVLRCSCCCTL